MNNTLHSKVSNAPPLARGKPLARQKLQGKRQKAKDESQKSWILNLGSWILISKGRSLLYLRDGPVVIGAPKGEADRGRYIPAQTQNPFVRPCLPSHSGGKPAGRLCEISAFSAVKTNNDTNEMQNHTGNHKAIILLNSKDSPQALHGSKLHAGGKFFEFSYGSIVDV